MGVSIFNTWFTYLRNSFNHDHIKKKVLGVHFHFICLDFLSENIFLCTATESSLLIIANYCFFCFSRIGDYVLNWSNNSFPCFMNIKSRGACFMNFNALGFASSFKVHKTWKTIV